MGDRTRNVFLTVMLCLLSLALMILVGERLSRKVEAQFQGYTALQTVTQSFSITMTGAQIIFALPQPGNPSFGPVGHTVSYAWGSSGTCVFLLQGSGDNTNWNTLAVGSPLGSATQVMLVANGFFPFLRLNVNPSANAACNTSSLIGVYTGYQVSIPLTQATQTPPDLAAIAAPVSAYTSDPAPYLVLGIQCFNPNAATAFLQTFDTPTSSPPTLGTAVVYQIGIAAGAAFSSGPLGFFGSSHLWLGAATARDGAVAVTTGLTCSVQVNRRGPFYPYSQF